MPGEPAEVGRRHGPSLAGSSRAHNMPPCPQVPPTHRLLPLSVLFSEVRLSLSFYFVHHPAERGLCGLHKGRGVGNSRECRDVSVLMIAAPVWLFRQQPSPGHAQVLLAISPLRSHIWRAHRYYIAVISL